MIDNIKYTIDSPIKRIENISTKTTMHTSIYSRVKKRKIILLGKMNSGKTSIINRFVNNIFPDKTQLTNEEMFYKNYNYKNEELKLNILDTAGQSSLTPGLPQRYTIGVHAYILVFSIEDNDSFEVIQHINKILLESIGTKYIPRVLVANKNDLESSREVSQERIKKLSKTLKCPFLECSALNGGEEMDKIFYKVLKEVDKENNDQYPYNIKNSSIKMNYIRKNHKKFNTLLTIMNSILLFMASILFFYFILLSFQYGFFNLFIILNLLISMFMCYNFFRGINIIKKQYYEKMANLNTGYIIALISTIFLLLLCNFRSIVDDSIYNNFNLYLVYLMMIILQMFSIYLNINLQPLYKEFFSSSAISQQLLDKI